MRIAWGYVGTLWDNMGFSKLYKGYTRPGVHMGLPSHTGLLVGL